MTRRTVRRPLLGGKSDNILAFQDQVYVDSGKLPVALSLTTELARATSRVWWARSLVCLQSLLVFLLQYSDQHSDKKSNIYNILWVLVFGFATLNILGLIARRFEPRRTGLSFGEILAITVVVVSVFLLGWEMLYLFHVLPIKLEPH